MFTLTLPRLFSYTFAPRDTSEDRSPHSKQPSAIPGGMHTHQRSDIADPAATLDHPSDIPGWPTAELLAAFTSDDVDRARDALTVIYDAYFDRLWRFAYHRVHSPDVAKELVQDLFLTLWTGRTSLTIHGSVSVYLYTAIRNRAFKTGRHEKVVARTEAAVEANTVEPPGVGTMTRPDVALDEAEAMATLRKLLTSMSPRDREVVVMRWSDRMTYADIAAALGISVSQVRTVLTRNEARLLAALDRTR